MCRGRKKAYRRWLKGGIYEAHRNTTYQEGGITTDEDAQYISNILNVKDDLESISPIVMTQQSIRQGLKDDEFSKGFLDLIDQSYQKIRQNKDLVRLEGAKSVEMDILWEFPPGRYVKKLVQKQLWF
ncbi:MAG: hypothetical protein U5N58_00380 [Actinomycetota bacterium]|nr:hypothetical protein [Actinomycetota bacterium]